MINGFDSMVVTKLDVLDHLDEIPVCVEYQRCGKMLDGMPATAREIETIEPVYELFPGWGEPTAGISHWDELPAQARSVSGVSGGANRRRGGVRLNRAGAESDDLAAGVAAGEIDFLGETPWRRRAGLPFSLRPGSRRESRSRPVRRQARPGILRHR